jgi:hypothetical protein
MSTQQAAAQQVPSKSGKGAPLQAVAAIRYKAIAILLWFCATFTTYLFLSSVIAYRLDTTGVIIAAVLAQLTLTVLESDFIRGRRSEVSVFAIVIDTLLNAAGLWPFVQAIDQTSVWIMLTELSGLTGGVSTYMAGLLAIIGGYVLAIAPEKIWR